MKPWGRYRFRSSHRPKELALDPADWGGGEAAETESYVVVDVDEILGSGTGSFAGASPKALSGVRTSDVGKAVFFLVYNLFRGSKYDEQEPVPVQQVRRSSLALLMSSRVVFSGEVRPDPIEDGYLDEHGY